MTYSTIALLSFLALLFSDIVTRINSFIGVSNGSTLLTLMLNVLTVAGLLLLAVRFRWREKMPASALLIFKFMMGWNLISLARGIFSAEVYWEWKVLLLGYVFAILVPVAIVLGLSYETSTKTLRFILRWVFVYGFAFVPIAYAYDTEMYSRVVMAASLFILFVPYLSLRWRLLVLAVAVVSVAMDPSYRVNLLRIVISLGLLALYFGQGIIRKTVLNWIVGLQLCLPLLFLYLGVTDQFNIFRDTVTTDSAVTVVEGGEIRESNLSVDTRTLLYHEVFYSMLKRDSSFLIGEGGGAGYESDSFIDTVVNESGRASSEVGFLNLVLYSGAIGVVLYAAMLFTAAYYAINRSNNTLCKMLGIFLGAHWVIFFIEDITKLDMNFYFIWFTVGLCFSHRFRALTDVQLRAFFLFGNKRVKA